MRLLLCALTQAASKIIYTIDNNKKPLLCALTQAASRRLAADHHGRPLLLCALTQAASASQSACRSYRLLLLCALTQAASAGESDTIKNLLPSALCTHASRFNVSVLLLVILRTSALCTHASRFRGTLERRGRGGRFCSVHSRKPLRQN